MGGAAAPAQRRGRGARRGLLLLAAAALPAAAWALRQQDLTCRMGPPCAFRGNSGCINATHFDYKVCAAAQARNDTLRAPAVTWHTSMQRASTRASAWAGWDAPCSRHACSHGACDHHTRTPCRSPCPL